MNADQLEAWVFPTTRRGYDPEQVDVVIAGAARALRAYEQGRDPEPDPGAAHDADRRRDEIASLHARLEDAERRAMEADDLRARAGALADQLRATEAAHAHERAVAERDLAHAEEELQRTRERGEAAERRAEQLAAELAAATQAPAPLADDGTSIPVDVEDAAVADTVVEPEETEPVSRDDDAWNAIGVQVATVLRAADEQAREILGEATERAAALDAESNARAEAVCHEADEYAATTRLAADDDAMRANAEADEAVRHANQAVADARSEAEGLVARAQQQAVDIRAEAVTSTRSLIERSTESYQVLAALAESSWSELSRRLDEMGLVLDAAKRQASGRVDLRLEVGEVLAVLDAHRPATADDA